MLLRREHWPKGLDPQTSLSLLMYCSFNNCFYSWPFSHSNYDSVCLSVHHWPRGILWGLDHWSSPKFTLLCLHQIHRLMIVSQILDYSVQWMLTMIQLVILHPTVLYTLSWQAQIFQRHLWRMHLMILSSIPSTLSMETILKDQIMMLQPLLEAKWKIDGRSTGQGCILTPRILLPLGNQLRSSNLLNGLYLQSYHKELLIFFFSFPLWVHCALEYSNTGAELTYT